MDGTLLGIVVGVLGTILVQMLQHSNETRRSLARRREEKLVDPIIQFVDEALQFLSDFYWRKLDGNDSGLLARIESLRAKESSVEARVHALAYPGLLEAYADFDSHIGKFRMSFVKGNLDEARTLTKSASEAAGALLRQLVELPSARRPSAISRLTRPLHRTRPAPRSS
ncbi:MAG: hypothetical protein WA208_01845 [Thermoanaerobaculia bacterium]